MLMGILAAHERLDGPSPQGQELGAEDGEEATARPEAQAAAGQDDQEASAGQDHQAPAAAKDDHQASRACEDHGQAAADTGAETCAAQDDAAPGPAHQATCAHRAEAAQRADDTAPDCKAPGSRASASPQAHDADEAHARSSEEADEWDQRAAQERALYDTRSSEGRKLHSARADFGEFSSARHRENLIWVSQCPVRPKPKPTKGKVARALDSLVNLFMRNDEGASPARCPESRISRCAVFIGWHGTNDQTATLWTAAGYPRKPTGGRSGADEELGSGLYVTDTRFQCALRLQWHGMNSSRAQGVGLLQEERA